MYSAYGTNGSISSSVLLPENRPGIHPLPVATLEAHVKNQTVIAYFRFLEGDGTFQKTHIKSIVNSL